MSFFSANTDFGTTNIEATQIVANTIISDFVDTPIIQSKEVIIEDEDLVETVFFGDGTVSSPLTLSDYKISFFHVHNILVINLENMSNVPADISYPGSFINTGVEFGTYDLNSNVVFKLKYPAPAIFMYIRPRLFVPVGGNLTVRIYNKEGTILFPSTSFPNEIPPINVNSATSPIGSELLTYEFQDILPANTEFIVLFTIDSDVVWRSDILMYYEPAF